MGKERRLAYTVWTGVARDVKEEPRHSEKIAAFGIEIGQQIHHEDLSDSLNNGLAAGESEVGRYLLSAYCSASSHTGDKAWLEQMLLVLCVGVGLAVLLSTAA